jgi:hypothetical protein
LLAGEKEEIRYVRDSEYRDLWVKRGMAAYNQKDIDDLIVCPKTISEPPKRDMKLTGADWRNDMKLIASDGTVGEFSVFMRRSDDFPENFSIGLIYHSNDERGEIGLIRCNGPHGVYNSGASDADHPHWDYHIHKASERALDAGERAERYADKTRAYASFEEAIQYFVTSVNLDRGDANKYFPWKEQRELDLS